MIHFQDEEEIIREVLSGKRVFGLKKEENFTLWFKVLLRAADIVEDRYEGKGMYMYPWYGYELISNILNHMEGLLREKGHKPEKYPSLVPLKVFMKEKDFLEGFQGEAYLIDKTLKGEKLDEPLVVRPTSETVMYNLWAKRLQSYKQLPIKVYQTVNVFRLETKMTKPLLRVREVMFFNEAHTAHKDEKEAEEQVKEAIEIYKKFYDDLAIPYLIIKTPEWDTFPGALYNYDFMSVLPDGKAIELGSIINLGQKFAKAFDIKFLDEKGKWNYVYQTCYGISERAVGTFIAIHGDEKGLVLLPEFAPVQIVIVPIYYNEEQKEKVLEKIKEIKKMLKEYRVEIDNSDKTPGFKFHFWEMKGVPVRIEIGMRDLEKEEVTLFRRDLNQKYSVKIDNLNKEIEKIFSEFKINLKRKAEEYFKKMLKEFENWNELKKFVKEGGRVAIVPLCGNKKCAEKIEEEIDLEVLGFLEGKGKCIKCGKETKLKAMIGKTY